ncbi:hypothetical protein EJV44_24855, partial [Ancylobacter aquaticus]
MTTPVPAPRATLRKDLRWRFLSNQNYYLMCSVLQFANEYIQGRYFVTNKNLMDCLRHNNRDVVVSTFCDLCREPFSGSQSRKLYVRSDKSIDITTPQTAMEKFKMNCFDCYLSNQFDSNYDFYELFPRLYLDVVEKLCELRFVNRYLFPVDLSHKIVKNTVKETHENVYEFFKSIVDAKKANEQIISVDICTLEKTLVSESANRFFLQKNLDEFSARKHEIEDGLIRVVPEESNILKFVNGHTHLNLTYYYV